MEHTEVDESRIQQQNSRPLNANGKCVVYWMQKDQRVADNWALLRAAELANSHSVPLVVSFFVWENIKNPYQRHFDFMLRGLSEVAARLRESNIGFVMRHQEPVNGICDLAREVDAVAVVTDQSYLRLGKQRRQRAGDKLNVCLELVDAAMIVPPAVLSDKQLWAAYIARPKLQDYLQQYLTDFPDLTVDKPWTQRVSGLDPAKPLEVLKQLKLGTSSPAVTLPSGSEAAQKAMTDFISERAANYPTITNDPMAFGTSRLSAYLHFGQLSAQRVAWEIKHSSKYAAHREAFDKYLDELITWRELSTNFAVYNSRYDVYGGVPDWAKKSLTAHAGDDREFLYSQDEFEQGKTHDELWNAAQLEMVKTGRMHGYLRMYWAKKILEWSPLAAVAIDTAVYLNDKYELDGREPNGYAGILWAIGGLHDRPWFEREVYGQIRYMNYNGAKKKFNVSDYVAWVASLPA